MQTKRRDYMRKSDRLEGPLGTNSRYGKGKILHQLHKKNMNLKAQHNVTRKESTLRSLMGCHHQKLRASNHAPITMVLHSTHFDY
jgi:hypothetical protein